jgi:hypothetical protein
MIDSLLSEDSRRHYKEEVMFNETTNLHPNRRRGGALFSYSRSNGFRWNALEDALRPALDAERPQGITT